MTMHDPDKFPEIPGDRARHLLASMYGEETSLDLGEAAELEAVKDLMSDFSGGHLDPWTPPASMRAAVLEAVAGSAAFERPSGTVRRPASRGLLETVGATCLSLFFIWIAVARIASAAAPLPRLPLVEIDASKASPLRMVDEAANRSPEGVEATEQGNTTRPHPEANTRPAHGALPPP